MTKNLKRTVDNGLFKELHSLRGKEGPVSMRDKASEGGITINKDVWAEMVTVGQLLCHIRPDPDIYDLFEFIRIELQGNQPFGAGLLERVDREIVKELGPWE